MLNGDKIQVAAHAAVEIVLNGNENQVTYAKYANGKKPLVTDNGSANLVQFEPKNSKEQPQAK